MKKSIRLLVVVLAVTACLGMLVGCSEKIEINKDFANWQTRLKDEVKLIDAIMPGSHDAGTKGMVVMAETQKHTIGEQLKSGIRCFDIRVKKSGNKLKIFHGPIAGVDFSDVLADIKEFIEQDNGQFIVLDFQHFENNVEEEVANLIRDNLQPDKYAVPENTVADLTMGEIRDKGYKYIVTWGSSKQTDRKYICYRGDTLYSPYYEDDHKAGGEKLTSETYGKYYDSVEKNRLFVLQGVVTAKNILQSIKDNDDKFSPLFDKYLDTIAATPALLDKTNIIMRDFIVSRQDQIAKIIALNESKGNFK